ncbi:hypothetical protein C8R46DRAFT_1231083 [Mycena filopes]|nr:hypothetical protein C8R46DRAFT_1231083 [Mycena filopes]
MQLPEEISGSTPFSGPGYCVVTDLLVMAMHDSAFMNVPSLETLQQMIEAAPPGPITNLQMKPEWLDKPILRAYTDQSHYMISTEKALKYATLYKQYESLGILAGFEVDVLRL